MEGKEGCALEILFEGLFFKLQDIISHDNGDSGHTAEGIDDSGSSSPADSSFVSQHALRQAELGRQLQELTKALALKEELANKMVANDSRLTSMRKQYEVKTFMHEAVHLHLFTLC